MKFHLVFSIILLFKLVIFVEFVQGTAQGLLKKGISPYYPLHSSKDIGHKKCDCNNECNRNPKPNVLNPYVTGGRIFIGNGMNVPNSVLRPNFDHINGATGLLESGVSPFYHIISNPNHLKPSFTDGGSIFNPNLRPNFAPVKGSYNSEIDYNRIGYWNPIAPQSIPGHYYLPGQPKEIIANSPWWSFDQQFKPKDNFLASPYVPNIDIPNVDQYSSEDNLGLLSPGEYNQIQWAKIAQAIANYLSGIANVGKTSGAGSGIGNIPSTGSISRIGVGGSTVVESITGSNSPSCAGPINGGRDDISAGANSGAGFRIENIPSTGSISGDGAGGSAVVGWIAGSNSPSCAGPMNGGRVDKSAGANSGAGFRIGNIPSTGSITGVGAGGNAAVGSIVGSNSVNNAGLVNGGRVDIIAGANSGAGYRIGNIPSRGSISGVRAGGNAAVGSIAGSNSVSNAGPVNGGRVDNSAGATSGAGVSIGNIPSSGSISGVRAGGSAAAGSTAGSSASSAALINGGRVDTSAAATSGAGFGIGNIPSTGSISGVGAGGSAAAGSTAGSSASSAALINGGRVKTSATSEAGSRIVGNAGADVNDNAGSRMKKIFNKITSTKLRAGSSIGNNGVADVKGNAGPGVKRFFNKVAK